MTPRIKKIGVIGGSGKMGSMFAQALQKIGFEVQVSDENTPTITEDLLKTCDWVILSVPIEKAPALAKTLGLKLREDQIFSDFTSVKTQIIPAMLESKASIISVHPLFGPMENMKGQNLILLPVRPKENLNLLKEIFHHLGLRVKDLKDWKKHDPMMSMLQGLIHFMHIVFSHTLKFCSADVEELIDFASPIYRANFAFACRILNRNPELYGHILMDNPQNLTFLKNYIAQAEKTLKQIENQHFDQFVADFLQTKNYLGGLAEEFALESEYLVEKMVEFPFPKEGSNVSPPNLQGRPKRYAPSDDYQKPENYDQPKKNTPFKKN